MPELLDEQPEQEQEIGGFRLPISAILRNLAPAMPTIPGAPQPAPEPAAAPVTRPASVDPYRDLLDKSMAAGSRLGELNQERQSISAPINPRDEQGKTKPEYRMGIGGRLLGALANFGSGMAGKGVVQYIGPGATNRRFTQEEEMRQGRLKGLDKDIEEQGKLAQALRQSYEAAHTGAYQQARGERLEGLLNQVKAGSEYQDEQGQWWGITNSGQNVKLPGEPKAYSIAQEKIKASKEKPEPDPKTTFGAWYRAFKEENRRVPNAKEILNWEVEQKKATRAPAGDQGTWQLGVDENNKPVMYNTKTGDVKDAARGVHKATPAPRGTQTFKDSAAVTKYSNDWYRKQQQDYNKRRANIEKNVEDATERDRQLKDLDAWDGQQKAEMEANKKQWYASTGGGKAVTVDEEGKQVAAEAPAPAPAKPAAAAKDFGPAPAGKPEGSTGTLKDGTKVIVRKGRIVAQ